MKLGDAILRERLSISNLAAAVLLIARLDLHHRAILHLRPAKHYDLKSAGQCLVGTPVRGQLRADDVRTARSNQVPTGGGVHLH